MMNWALVIGGFGAVAALVVALVVLVSLDQTVSPSVQQTGMPFTVAATIFPLADIVRTVGGDSVDVLLIIPPGVSEHSGELKPQQLADLERARLLFQVGVQLDDRVVERITRALPTIHSVAVDTGIQLREFGEEEEHAEEDEQVEEEHDHGSLDPHYWLAVPNAVRIADTVARTLIELDPAHAAVYRENLERYQRELAVLEADLQKASRALPRKEFLAMHDAWSYFADQYGLDLVATYEPIEGKQPSVADLQRISEVIQQYGITTFYTEPQKTTSAVTQLFADEFDVHVGVLDPVGGLEAGDSYVALMRRNMEALAAGAQ